MYSWTFLDAASHLCKRVCPSICFKKRKPFSWTGFVPLLVCLCDVYDEANYVVNNTLSITVVKLIDIIGGEETLRLDTGDWVRYIAKNICTTL